MWPARAFRAASTRHAHSVAPPALSACSPQQYAVAFLQVLQKYVRRTLQLATRTPLTSQRAPKSDQTGTRGGGGVLLNLLVPRSATPPARDTETMLGR